MSPHGGTDFFASCEMLKLLILELFHSVVTECIIYSNA